MPDEIKVAILDEAKVIEEEIAVETELNGYDIDGLEIGAEFNATISDREINIFDAEIEFDNKNYDAKEVVYLTGLKVAANYEEEYKADAYLQIPEEGLKYCMEFETGLNTSLIAPDETLVFNLFGEEVEISNWDSGEITFTKGVKYDVIEGDTIEYDGIAIFVKDIIGDSIFVTVNSETKRIVEGGDVEHFDGVEIKAEAVLDNEAAEGRPDWAEIIVSTDVTNDVYGGKEYADDSIWDWGIDANSICVSFNTE